MKLTIIIKQHNADFDPEEFEFLGEETEENFRYLWEDEIEVTDDVVDFKVKNNAVYTLRGATSDGVEFALEIPDMTIAEATTKGGEVIPFSVSKRLLKRTEKNELEDHQTEFVFYLKGSKDFHNPVPGVFIDPDDFPEELLLEA